MSITARQIVHGTGGELNINCAVLAAGLINHSSASNRRRNVHCAVIYA